MGEQALRFQRDEFGVPHISGARDVDVAYYNLVRSVLVLDPTLANKKQVEEIAKLKLDDFNTTDLEVAKKTVAKKAPAAKKAAAPAKKAAPARKAPAAKKAAAAAPAPAAEKPAQA